MPNIIELLHNFVHDITFMMRMMLMRFPFSGFGSLGYVFCDVGTSTIP